MISPRYLKCPKAISILSQSCDLKKAVDDGQVLVESRDFFNIPIRDFQKSHPGIFRDFQKPVNCCFLRLLTQFIDKNKTFDRCISVNDHFSNSWLITQILLMPVWQWWEINDDSKKWMNSMHYFLMANSYWGAVNRSFGKSWDFGPIGWGKSKNLLPPPKKRNQFLCLFCI